MLTPYDEFPVHQAPHPFSHIPSTDIGWDDGYYLGAFSPEADVFIYTGMRVNPNADVIGGYAGIAHAGRQYTIRCSREWSPNFEMTVGPLTYTVIEPFRDIRVTLAAGDGLDLSFDFNWLGVSPPWQQHQVVHTRSRRTTEVERYLQVGRAKGAISSAGQSFGVEPDTWFGFRDHSWGLYNQRAPLAADARWLPPTGADGPPAALRLWLSFVTSGYTGNYFVHETADGSPWTRPGSFDVAAGGHIHQGWNHVTTLVVVEHELEFETGTRVLRGGTVRLVDADGGTWTQEFRLVRLPWLLGPVGYELGSWRDGGTIQTYHGAGVDGTYIESDIFDISVQPLKLTTYDGLRLSAWGAEYAAAITLIDPHGAASSGAGQLELILDGRHDAYGFTDDPRRAPGHWGAFAVLEED